MSTAPPPARTSLAAAAHTKYPPSKPSGTITPGRQMAKEPAADTPPSFPRNLQIGIPKPPAGSPFGKGRMVPDVAADADPNTGYNVFVHGAKTVVGGTSAVAPLYAGLFAAFGKKLGFVTPSLYQNQPDFNDITSGGNGYYSAAPGPTPAPASAPPSVTSSPHCSSQLPATTPTPRSRRKIDT